MGEFGDQPVLDRAQMHRLDEVLGRMDERVVGARADHRKSPARNAAAGEIDVVEHGQARKQRGDLIGAAQAAPDALIGREGGDVLAEEPDRARARQEISGDAVEQRRLAGAVGAEHRATLARPHRQRDIGQRRERAEQPRDAAQFERIAGPDRGEALSDAIHGRRPPGSHSRSSPRDGASAPKGRSRRRARRTRWRGSRARSAAGSGCRRGRWRPGNRARRS